MYLIISKNCASGLIMTCYNDLNILKNDINKLKQKYSMNFLTQIPDDGEIKSSDFIIIEGEIITLP